MDWDVFGAIDEAEHESGTKAAEEVLQLRRPNFRDACVNASFSRQPSMLLNEFHDILPQNFDLQLLLRIHKFPYGRECTVAFR